jgi:hypothetical protein
VGEEQGRAGAAQVVGGHLHPVGRPQAVHGRRVGVPAAVLSPAAVAQS